MLKKSLAIGLSVVMAAEVLTGCSGGSGTTETKAADTGKTEAAASEAATEGGSGEEKTLTVFHYMGQSVKQQGLEKLEEEFKKTHPNITFENIFYNQGTDYFPQLSTALASGEQPDIIMGNPATYPDLIENGYAMDLTDNDVIKNLNVSPEDLNDASANGKVYAVPIDFKASGFFYNVKMFKENGLEVPKTLTEFDQLVETLHSKGIDPFIDLYGEGSTGDIETRGIIVPRAVAAGDLDLYEKLMSGEKKLTDYDYMDEALSVWDKRMTYPRMDAMANNQDKALELFVTGQGAMIFTGNWNLEGRNMQTIIVLLNPGMIENADCAEEAVEFLEYWVTDGALTWSETTMMPLITGESSDKLLPVVKSMAELKANSSISQGIFTKPFNTEFVNAWRKGLISYAESVCTGKPMTHEECLNNIQSLFDDIIATSK